MSPSIAEDVWVERVALCLEHADQLVPEDIGLLVEPADGHHREGAGILVADGRLEVVNHTRLLVRSQRPHVDGLGGELDLGVVDGVLVRSHAVDLDDQALGQLPEGYLGLLHQLFADCTQFVLVVGLLQEVDDQLRHCKWALLLFLEQVEQAVAPFFDGRRKFVVQQLLLYLFCLSLLPREAQLHVIDVARQGLAALAFLTSVVQV